MSAEAIETYLRCPKRYEFAHVQALSIDADRSRTDERVDLLRGAICDGLRTGNHDSDALEEAIFERLSALWDEYDGQYHSRAQRRLERRVLESTARAYVGAVGEEHVRGIETLRRSGDGQPDPIGPNVELSTTMSIPRASTEADPSARTVGCESTIDYVTADGGSLVGVRFVPTTASLGLVRYRSSWEGDLEALFADHFDPDSTTFEPGPVAALLETAIVLDGLRAFADRNGLGEYTCRYVQIPLADRSSHSVNWVRESVDATVSPIDLTDRFVDHQSVRRTHEHRNDVVESRLRSLLERIVAGSGGSFDPDRWERIESESCPECAYAVCCSERLAREVGFDG